MHESNETGATDVTDGSSDLTESGADSRPAADEEHLTEYDKTLADSFPSSDPPAQP